jgi:hypothetical protein
MSNNFSVILALISGFTSIFVYGPLLLFIFDAFRSINSDILFLFELFHVIGGIIIIVGAFLAAGNKKSAWIVLYCGAIFTFLSLILMIIVQSSGNLFVYTTDPLPINFIYVILLFFTNGTTFNIIAATIQFIQGGER